jgi:hypothetical protein
VVESNQIEVDIVAVGNSNTDDWYKKSDDNTKKLTDDNSSPRLKPDGRPGSEDGKSDTASNRPSQSGINWLADSKMLPASMRQARIMEFHYPPKGDEPKQIEGTAKSFLERLREQIHAYPTRPVIFVAHEKGGLILEKALVLDSEAASPQLIRSRYDNATDPKQAPSLHEGTPHSPSNPNLQPPVADGNNSPQTDEAPPNNDLDAIPEPSGLNLLSRVAGAVFLETSLENPDGDERFHLKFARVVVEWDIPVRWYRSKKQAKSERSAFKVIFNCPIARATPANFMFSIKYFD